MRSKLGTRIFGAALAVALGSPFGVSSMAQAQTPTPVPRLSVKLTAAPAASTFSIGQPVTVNFQLTNTGGTAVRLSDLTDGNLRIVSFQRNGIDVPTRKTSVDYDDDLANVLSQSLKLVAPGASIAGTWTSALDDGANGLREQALTAVTYANSGQYTAQLFGLGSSGTYTVAFYYEYPTASGPAGTFLGKTNTATVTFNVF